MRANDSESRLQALRATPLAAALARAAAPDDAWLVGGAVRDAALGRAPRGGPTDLDVVVADHAVAIAERLATELGGRVVRLGGDRFGAVRVVTGAGELDLWSLEGGPLAPDLERRDFTVNAVALELATGALVDPYGGLDDLRRRRLRATRAGVFAEDPLRVVRLARFAATLDGFACEPATIELARAAAGELEAIAGERIRQELARLWTGSSHARAARALAESGAWPLLWRDRREPAPEARPELYFAAAERLDETAHDSRRATVVSETRTSIEGKTTGSVAAGHALATLAASGPAGAAGRLRRLGERAALSRSELRLALALVALCAEAVPRDEGDLAWFLHRAGAEYPSALGLAAGFAASATAAEEWRAAVERAARLMAARGGEILEPRPLLSGEEIGALLGLAPGPELGAAVRRLGEAQVRGTVTSILDAKALLTEGERGGQSGPGERGAPGSG